MSMKKKSALLVKSVLAIFMCWMLVGCERESEPITFYPIAKVSKFERDSYTTILKYGNFGLSEYDVFINNTLAYSGGIYYKPSSIIIKLDGVQYDFQLGNTKGVSRVETVTASVGNAKLYHIQYWFEDPEGRISLARVDGVDGESNYVLFKYEDNNIIVSEKGIDHIIELSSSENLGNVCNVMGLAGPELTSKYVFHPDFYFLNIYGTPMNRLPLGQEIVRSADNQQLLRVGKYTYEY